MGGVKHEAGSGDGVSYRAPKDPSHCAPMCTVLCDPNYPPPNTTLCTPGRGVGIPLLWGWFFSPGG